LKEKHKTSTILITIFIIICLFAASYYVFFYQKEETEKKVEEKEIDNRINPLGAPQAVFLKINRIRKKGIVDFMMNAGYATNLLKKIPIKNPYFYPFIDGLRPGIGWRKKPSFTYTAVLDGYEYKRNALWTGWDTDYINQEFFRKVKEEQQQTEVKLTIVEKEKKFTKTIEKEIEGFCVVYDFRYGNWTGDDYFNDSDGYGHYNGSNYEIWFNIRQTSYDGDDIPYWTEVNILGTDPTVDDSKLDPDNDGIDTEWEWKWGYDPFKYDNHTYLDPDNDGLQNNEEYFMKKWLANPFYREIYIETDHEGKRLFRPLKITIKKGKILPIPRPKLEFTGDGWECLFWEESQQMLIETFNEHGITVHIDDGCMGGGGELLPKREGNYNQEGGTVAEYYNNNFSDERKGIFRYVVIASGGGWCHPQDNRHFYDTMCVPTSKRFFKNQLAFAVSQRGRRIGRAVQVLHELGHSLGLRREEWAGVDCLNFSEYMNYKSSMNYYYFGLRYYGYSDGTHGENDRNDWAALDLTYFQKPAQGMEGLGWEDWA
jgi:hypothetical protein